MFVAKGALRWSYDRGELHEQAQVPADYLLDERRAVHVFIVSKRGTQAGAQAGGYGNSDSLFVYLSGHQGQTLAHELGHLLGGSMWGGEIQSNTWALPRRHPATWYEPCDVGGGRSNLLGCGAGVGEVIDSCTCALWHQLDAETAIPWDGVVLTAGPPICPADQSSCMSSGASTRREP